MYRVKQKSTVTTEHYDTLYRTLAIVLSLSRYFSGCITDLETEHMLLVMMGAAPYPS